MTPSPDPPDLLGSKLGQFRIRSKLGEGGMGVVYDAWDERLRRAVALKVLPARDLTDEERRRRILREARAAAALTHPNLAAIYEVGEAENQVFIAMERVRGTTLRELLLRGALRVDEALSIARGIAAGLAGAHETGIVHADVKPENVMVTGDGHVKILDFGLAETSRAIGRDPDENEPREEGCVIGTPAYMAPERALGRVFEPRSDVYSFGVVLYEMLTGRHPFPEPTGMASILAVGREPALRPSVRVPAVAPEVDDLVLQCLETDASRRPANGRALVARLQRISRSSEGPLPLASATGVELTPGATGPARRPSTNVVAPVDLIGRDEEVQELGALLGGAPGLITLFGPGGTGKTRLALHVADMLRDSFAGGTWFCDLGEARDAADVHDVAGRVLGVPAAPDDRLERFSVALAARGRVLVVLDNFEQVAGCAAETLVPWMARAPQASLLVTSREVLRVEGERLYALAPLPVPEPDATFADIASAGAVELFVERARAVQPGFALDEHNMYAVATLVRRLDGIPLAIELAAARLRVFDPERLLERMPRRFELLAQGRRDVSRRQATMRGTIDWSWNLLSPWEQAALAQCAVFRGGFSLEAAEAVLDLSAWPEAPWALDVIQALGEKSLLRTWRPDGALGDARHGMYESIHEYALERLGQMGPEVARAARARHMLVYVECAIAAAGADASRTGDLGVMGLLSLEHDNLRAALDTALGAGGAPPETALRLAVAMWRYWLLRGCYAEGRAYLDAGLSRWPARDALRARAAGAVAGLATMLGDFGAARASEEEALSIWRELGDGAGAARSLTSLGFQAYRLGELSRSMALCLEGLAAARSVPGPMPLAFCLNIAGMAATKLRRLDEARAWLDEAASVCRRAGNRSYLANVLESLGTAIYAASADHAAALPCYRECLEIYRDVGDLGGVPMAVERFAQIAVAQGDSARAARLFGAGRAMRARLGAELEPVMEKEYAPYLFKLRVVLGDRRFDDLYASGRALSSADAISLALS